MPTLELPKTKQTIETMVTLERVPAMTKQKKK